MLRQMVHMATFTHRHRMAGRQEDLAEDEQNSPHLHLQAL